MFGRYDYVLDLVVCFSFLWVFSVRPLGLVAGFGSVSLFSLWSFGKSPTIYA